MKTDILTKRDSSELHSELSASPTTLHTEDMTKNFLGQNDTRKINLNKAMTIVILLCCLDMTITYFALNKYMTKYPDTWREKELSFTVGPMLRYAHLDLIPALILGAIINSALYTTVIRKMRTEFVYGLVFGAVMLAVLSNARIAWLM